MQFRHLEFTNAYNAVQLQERNNDENKYDDLSSSFQFDDATPTTDELDDLFGAIQFINLLPHDHQPSTLSTKIVITQTALLIRKFLSSHQKDVP